jgi:transcriptional regulator with XRE-family HTH domain
MTKTSGKKRNRAHVFLREWRLHRGLTQVQASERIGVDQSTIAKIEQGKLPYNEDFLERAALAYGCEPGDLISVNPLAPDDIKALRTILEQAPRDARARAIDVLKALLKAS